MLKQDKEIVIYQDKEKETRIVKVACKYLPREDKEKEARIIKVAYVLDLGLYKTLEQGTTILWLYIT